jgi:peptidoglycan/LPS O-acetylase OafA/YrhL
MTVVERTLAANRPSSAGGQFAARFLGKNVAYPLGYMAALDGMRGFLTLGVLLAHTRMALFGGAMVYMDVFFTMSGYLITSLLIKDYEKRGRISLKNFYVRRFMRLYPALTAMVLCLIAVSWIFSPNFRDRINEALVSWFYLMDYSGWFISTPVEYTGHTWSLAVEEQFYLLWPLMFIGLLWMGGLTVRTSLIIFAIAAAFWIWKIVLDYNGAPTAHLYRSFDCRADALFIGCALAVLLKAIDISSYPRFYRLCAYSLLPIAMVMIVLGFTMDSKMRWYYCVSPLITALPAAICVIGLLHPQRTFMHTIYEHPVPVFIGRICYGLYIWHFPIFTLVAAWAPKGAGYITTFLVGWPITFAIATLSHYLIERPFMRARPGF